MSEFEANEGTGEPPQSSDSRARGKKKAKGKNDVRPSRVRHVMHLMGKGLWLGAITSEALMSRWKVSSNTMKSYAAEASRRIREGIMLDEELRAQVLSTIQSIAIDADEIAKLARKAAEPVPPPPNAPPGTPAKPPKSQSITEAANSLSKALSVKLDAVKAFADISGAKAATKVEISNNLTDLMDKVHQEHEQELRSKTPA